MAFRVQTRVYPDDRELLSELEWHTVPGGDFSCDHDAYVAAQKIFETQNAPTRVVNSRGATLKKYPIEPPAALADGQAGGHSNTPPAPVFERCEN